MHTQIEDAIQQLLSALSPSWRTDADLYDTPKRVAKMFADELCVGLTSPRPALTTFLKPLGMDRMVVVGPIAVRGLCPHHLAPIIGRAWVGVLPGTELLGLSKYARLVRWCAARPAMQETVTELIASELSTALDDANGIAVLMRAEHLCMKWRGVAESETLTTTSAMRGHFRSDSATRDEFFRLAGSGK